MAAMLTNTIKILRFSEIGYRKAYMLQEHLVKVMKNRIKEDRPSSNVLILLEHTPVYTTGIRTKDYSAAEEDYLLSLGADFVRTNRGGLITFHGPAQLVAYPILNLKNFVPQANRRKAGLGMRWYINTLEEVVIKVCSELGLEGTRSPHTGVWVGENKVCAMGVHSSQLVTSHGLALNSNVDLSWFNQIVPCGIVGKGVTSLSRELDRKVNVAEVEPLLIKHFSDQFSAEIFESSPDDLMEFVPPDLGSTPLLKYKTDSENDLR